MKKTKFEHLENIVGNIVLFFFFVPVIYLVFRMIYPSESLPKITADYLLMLVQCLLGIVACFIPSIVSKHFKIEIPSLMTIMYLVFLYCAIFLGEVRYFYINFENWDTILHTMSGFMMGCLGFSFVNILNDYKEDTHLKLSPSFVAFFALCFSVTLGTIWEIYEFAADEFLGFNMQKFRLPDGTELVGHLAIVDTMNDLVVDFIGAFVAVMIGYISLKYKTGWIEKVFLRKNKALKETTALQNDQPQTNENLKYEEQDKE